jgi:hypothetical protein
MSKKVVHRRETLEVTARERQIFREVMVELRRREEVAARYGLSERQVANITSRVSRWLSQPKPAGYEEPSRQAVLRTFQAKLEYYEEEAREAFERSKLERTFTESLDVRNVEGRPVVVRRKVKCEVRRSPGDIRYLQTAERIARQRLQVLAELEGRRGHEPRTEVEGFYPDPPRLGCHQQASRASRKVRFIP